MSGAGPGRLYARGHLEMDCARKTEVGSARCHVLALSPHHPCHRQCHSQAPAPGRTTVLQLTGRVGLRTTPHPPQPLLHRAIFLSCPSAPMAAGSQEGERGERAQWSPWWLLGLTPTRPHPVLCPGPELHLGITPSGLISGLGEIGGGQVVPGADWAEQAWPGRGSPRLCSEAPLQCPPRSRPHVCMCIYVFVTFL